MSVHFDVVVVGSGFGGSVTALRLTEKGYKAGVLEAGLRFGPDDLPKTLRRCAWHGASAGRPGCASGSIRRRGAPPSRALAITAQTERAMSFWPNKGEPDRRPLLGAPYEPIAPTLPKTPAVPLGAPAAMRLPSREEALG